MPQKTNLNTTEYNDDFDSTKGFYKVLFRPGYSIQTRELNAIQSILQNQIEQFGKYQFKQGQQVIPGEVSFNNRLDYVKLASVSEVAENVGGTVVFRKYDIKSLINKESPIVLTGLTSGVKGIVVEAEYGTETESDILFVNYISGGDNSEDTFRQGETLEANIPNSPLLVVGTDSSSLPTSVISIDPDTLAATKLDSPAMAFASAVKVERGIYFVNGFFVENEDQILVIDKYYTQPSRIVGFNIVEEIVTAEQDSSLYDNARGFSNFTSPGAHRLKVKLELVSYDINAQTDANFIPLLTVKLGVIQKKVITTDYNLLEETLARRTYDESGDYVVDNFPVEIREYWQRGDNQGLYPTRVDDTVNGLPQEEAEAKLVAGIGSGKAYVRGFELVNKETKFKAFNKARDVLVKDNNRINYSGLSGFNLRNVYNSVPFNSEGEQLTSYPTIYFSSVFNDGYLGYNGSSLASRLTESRRGTLLRNSTKTNAVHDYVIKTVYVKLKSPVTNVNNILGEKLYYVSSLGETLAATTTNYAEVVAVSQIARPDDVGGELYAELTLLGNKRDLIDKFIEYDKSDFIPAALLDTSANTEVKRRQLFYKTATSSVDNGAFNAQNYYWQSTGTTVQVESITYSSSDGLYYGNVTTAIPHGLTAGNSITISGAIPDAYNKTGNVIAEGLADRTFSYQLDVNPNSNASGNITLTIPITQTNRILPYGEIVDYSEAITPVIGIAKPKDFRLVRRGFGFNQEIDKILSKGRTDNGESSYNSIFNLEYFNPIFFTKIITSSKITAGFSAGKYFYGSKSNAYGVIEGSADSSYSSSNELFVRVLFGNFLSGETLIDEDGNNLQIAKENTISHFVVTKRGGGYSQSTPAASNNPITVNGVPFDASSIKPSFVGGKVFAVEILNRNLVSKEYTFSPSVSVSYDSGVTPTSFAVVKAVLFKNVVTSYSSENVKSVHMQFGSNNANTFTADVEYFDDEFISNKNVTNFTFSGTSGKKELICLAFSGDASLDLVPGDVIQYVDDNNVIRRSFVEKVIPPTSTTKSIIYLDDALKANVTNSVIVRKRTKLNNGTNTLLFPTGVDSVNSLIKNSDDTGIKYYIRRDFITTSSAAAGEITFSAQLKFGTQRFLNFTESHFLLTVLDKGNSNTGIENGDILYLRPDQVGSPSGSPDNQSTIAINIDNLTFRTDASTASNVVLKLTATIEVDKASPRIKTAIRNKRIVVSSSGDRIIPVRGYDYDNPSSQIVSYSDCFGEYGVDIKVFEGSISSPPILDDRNNVIEGTDVTYKFTFDDGQRDTFYDVSRIVLKPGFDTPTGQIVVVFNYFEHSQGDFATVDSYVLGGVPLEDIPFFNSPSLGRTSLRDVIDFRPKVDVNTIITGFQDQTILQSENTVSFIGSGGIAAYTPAHDPNVPYTFGYSSKQFLDRIDGVFLSKKGEFIIKEGNAALNPSKPESPDDAIALYYLYIPAYTYNPTDVRVMPVDNRRYTMRDIGKLEKRIERLEYYTTLSILEQQALNTQVKDDIGFDRFKSGIIVDSFENHAVGNLPSIDYQCAIDTRQSILRPKSIETSLALTEKDSSSTSRVNNGYVNNNGVISLPFSNRPFVSNRYATSTINPNPFVVVQYVGDLHIDTPVDHWFDDTKSPVILNNDTKVFSVFVSKADATEGYASLNDFYLTNWVGTNRTFYNVSSLRDVTTSSTSTVTPAITSISSNISPYNNEIGKGIQTVSNGDSVVSSSIQLFARSRAIKFNLTRLRPNTRFYAFIDGRNVYRWVSQDTVYTGIPGNSLGTFGSSTDESAITTDSEGNASGLLIFPAGNSPAQGSVWTGDLGTVVYDTSETATKLNFPTGVKTIRFTSSDTDANDSSVISFAECKYYCVGSFPSQPASIVSTLPAFLKAAEGIQFIDSASSQSKPSPLSQTFKVENYPGGMFATAVDLFFRRKSSTIPLRVYLSDSQSGKPGSHIIPGTEKVLSPNTYLKIYTNGDLQVTRGEIISGTSSGVVGIIENVVDKNNNDVPISLENKFTLSNDQVYTLVLSNTISDGSPFVQNEILNIPSVNLVNTLNNSNLTVTIAKDSGKITGLKILNYGAGYESATLIIQSPQLPGSSNALGNIFISNGEVFEAEVLLQGSGYTELPSVNIRPNGSVTREAEIVPILTIDTPAVRMGISIDPQDGQTADSVTPTRFFFDHPVYLLNNTEYTLNIETDSLDYELWSSRLGESDVATSEVITQQPLLGSVFRSQNLGTWLEDINQDIKFTLHRASFDTSSFANVILTNEDLGYELLSENSIETDSSSNESATSTLFKNNNKVVNISHRNNGFEFSNSYVSFKQVEDVGGIESNTFNTNLFKVNNNGFNHYTITVSLGAGSSNIGGGSKVLASYNRKYEKLYPQVSYLSFAATPFDSYVKTTNIIPLDSSTLDYNSYSISDYERTFLNEENYFTNQKVVCSYFNEIKNDIDNSLSYKFVFSSNQEYLSPVIDLRSSSVKLSSTEVDKSYGSENKYGRRLKKLKFYPVYKFTVVGLPTDSNNQPILPTTAQSVTGKTTNARGNIVRVNGATIYVKVKNDATFVAGEPLEFSSGDLSAPSIPNASVGSSGVIEFEPEFSIGTRVETYFTNLTERFSTKIYGTIVSWDDKNKELSVLEEKQPISDDYFSSTETTEFQRDSSNGGSNQEEDIIRVGDNIWHQRISPASVSDSNESRPGFLEVSKVSYSAGVLYSSETSSKNSSALAKYVTKEITLQNPSTTIEVRLNANLLANDDVELYYRTKPTNSQQVFDDVEWIAFNTSGEADYFVEPSNEKVIAASFERQSSYKEYKYSVSNLTEFDSFAIKVVMKSADPCYIPKVQDVRIIAAF